MRRFRRLQAALLAALAAAVVTGCGREAVNAGERPEPGSVSAPETSETAPPEEEEELPWYLR